MTQENSGFEGMPPEGTAQRAYDGPPSGETPPYPPYPPSAPYPPNAPNTYGQMPSSGQPGQMPPGAYPYGAYPYTYAPGYAGPMAPQTSGWAIASLVCSIAGWLGFWLVGHLLGVIFGHIALSEINSSDGRIEGRGLAMAGLVIGYIGLGISALFIVGVIIFVLVVRAAQP